MKVQDTLCYNGNPTAIQVQCGGFPAVGHARSVASAELGSFFHWPIDVGQAPQ